MTTKRAPNDAEIATAARKWNALRRTAIRLHDARNEYECANEEPFARVGPSRVEGVPCWKPLTPRFDGDELRFADRDDWCAACIERQKAHDEFRATCKARGTAMRSLQQLCAKRDRLWVET